MLKHHILAATEIDFLIDYAKNQFAKANGLHLNSSDWKPYIKVGSAMFYKFIISGIINFTTKTDISGKKYDQIVRLTEHKRIEPALLILFLLKLEDEKIVSFMSEFLKKTNARVSCSCPAFCLEKNTKIKLADNRTLTISELLDEYENGKDNYVFSINSDDRPVINKINKIWISGKSNRFVKITLDNNNSIITTPEHFYITSDKTDVMAKGLSVGDKLLSLYFSEDSEMYNYDDIKDRKYNTHKIIKIENIEYDTEQDVFDIEVENDHNFYAAAGVVLHNSYWGPAFNLTSIDAIYGPGEMRAPDIRDKDRDNLVCKHLWVVLETYEKQIRYFSVGLLPYYKRLFGITSPTGVDRLKAKLGSNGIKKLIENAIISLNKTNKSSLITSFKELTKDTINSLADINQTSIENPNVLNNNNSNNNLESDSENNNAV